MNEITEEELQAINKAVEVRYGIDFSSYEPSSFKRRVTRVMNKMEVPSVMHLWRKILNEHDFIYEFINELTVGLTELFRNPDLWAFLKTDILPSFKHEKEIWVWHAGCSTGEEVYTFSITAKEAFLKRKTHQLAGDINRKFLEQAQSGKYSSILTEIYERNFLSYNPKGSIHDYFDVTEQSFEVKNECKTNIYFEEQNLVRYKPSRKFHLIFCRNVMIYFDQALKKRLLETFHNSLVDGGYLVIGYFDALPREHEQWFTMAYPTYKMFKKKTS